MHTCIIRAVSYGSRLKRPFLWCKSRSLVISSKHDKWRHANILPWVIPRIRASRERVSLAYVCEMREASREHRECRRILENFVNTRSDKNSWNPVVTSLSLSPYLNERHASETMNRKNRECTRARMEREHEDREILGKPADRRDEYHRCPTRSRAKRVWKLKSVSTNNAFIISIFNVQHARMNGGGRSLSFFFLFSRFQLFDLNPARRPIYFIFYVARFNNPLFTRRY